MILFFIDKGKGTKRAGKIQMKAIKNSKGAYQKKNIRYIPPPLIAVKHIRIS